MIIILKPYSIVTLKTILQQIGLHRHTQRKKPLCILCLKSPICILKEHENTNGQLAEIPRFICANLLTMEIFEVGLIVSNRVLKILHWPVAAFQTIRAKLF